jgi:hypothetical protein
MKCSQRLPKQKTRVPALLRLAPERTTGSATADRFARTHARTSTLRSKSFLNRYRRRMLNLANHKNTMCTTDIFNRAQTIHDKTLVMRHVFHQYL